MVRREAMARRRYMDGQSWAFYLLERLESMVITSTLRTREFAANHLWGRVGWII